MDLSKYIPGDLGNMTSRDLGGLTSRALVEMGKEQLGNESVQGQMDSELANLPLNSGLAAGTVVPNVNSVK